MGTKSGYGASPYTPRPTPVLKPVPPVNRTSPYDAGATHDTEDV